MHDDSRLVEERLDRAVRDRIRPAVYSHRAGLEVSAWHVPGEPVPLSDALAATYEPFAVGEPWGKAWSTTWFRLRGQVPQAWSGRRVEAVVDLGFTDDMPGFQAEGMVYDASSNPLKGVHPRNRYVPVAHPAGE